MMRKPWNTALSFYHSTHTAQNVLKKLRQSGFVHSVSMHVTHGGAQKASIFRPNTLQIAISLLTLFLSLGTIAIGYFQEIWTPTIAVLILGCTWCGYLSNIWRTNFHLINKYKKCVIRDEILIAVLVHEKDIRQVIDILRRVTSFHPVSFLHRSEITHHLPPPALQELLSIENLQLYASEVAPTHNQIQLERSKKNPLKKLLKDTSRQLEEIRYNIAEGEEIEQVVGTSADWLLDNMYVIQNSIEEIRRGISPKYYRELPKILSNQGEILPRIYIIAQEIINRTANRLNRENLTAFLKGYLSTGELTIGELWALPLMLQLRLLKSIKLYAAQLEIQLHESEAANFWGNRLLSVARREPARFESFFMHLQNQHPKPSLYFVDGLLDHIYDEETILPKVTQWIEEKLNASLSEISQEVHLKKTTDETAFSSAIVSLITLSQLIWGEILEEVSPVEAILRQDPAGIYPDMNFATRDRYRHALEIIARRSTSTEMEVAEQILKMALVGQDKISRHVGYYLIDNGVFELEKSVKSTPTLKRQIQRWMKAHPALIYIGSIGLVTLLIESSLAYFSLQSGSAWVETTLLLALALFPASEVGVQLLNFFIPRILPPSILPKMDFEKGIPQEHKTLVVIPSLMQGIASIDKTLDQLEIHYLANPDPVLKFSIFFDLPDAQQAVIPEDTLLIEHAIKRMQNLDEKYGKHQFFLFLRARIWSASENSWIGWERKRGKLEALNRYLIETNYPETILRYGERQDLDNMRYVITLDNDTQLPKDTAKQMVETIVHPLNAAQLSPENLVKRGYTIIQPLVSTDFSTAKKTIFSSIFSDATGIDPYTHAISDVYQNLDNEGTYHGKAIYDLPIFDKILSGRFPSEQILSHDLLEGSYVRTGFASEILLFDEFPETYLAWSKRQHRWFRGDWQIADWIFSKVPNAQGQSESNPLSPMNRWKVFDNLRRALLLPAILALLLFSWFIPHTIGQWNLLAWVSLALPVVAVTLCQQFSTWRMVTLFGKQFITILERLIVTVALMPHQAKNSLDALFKVIYRRCVSHRNLLEWNGNNSNITASGHKMFIFRLAVVSLASAFLLGILSIINPAALTYAYPFCLLWIIAPLIANFIDKKPAEKSNFQNQLSKSQRHFLGRIARRTWRYFDDFVGPASNWLPPDNFQAALNIEIAKRTSPTNIGLWFIAVISANDFKYLTCDESINRIRATFQTLGNLELYEGHLLNWYDTQTLKPLYPRYVSTVDNGNFIASLWTLDQSLQQLLKSPILPLSFLDGLADTFDAFLEESKDILVSGEVQQLKTLLSLRPDKLTKAIGAIKPMAILIEKLLSKQYSSKEQRYWLQKLKEQLADWEQCRLRYFEWVDVLGEATIYSKRLDIDTIALFEVLSISPSLQTLASGMAFIELQKFINTVKAKPNLPDDILAWVTRLNEAVQKSQWLAGEATNIVSLILNDVRRLSETDMSFLYNPQKRLFTIGFNVEDLRPDNSHYDLLASEARISSLIAIAKGDVPLEHWWALSRPYRIVDGLEVLVSWSGTMFEYLMPMLFMKHYDDTLLGDACKKSVICQIDYANKRGIPWGISEAAYSEIDAHKTYQYRSFGVPGLGYKRGLEEDLVVSPYSTALALSIDPLSAVNNFQRLHSGKQSLYSTHGFYESIDYSRQHGPHGERGLIIYAFMAHHQGMSLLALNNILNGQPIIERFHSDPRIIGVESLLFERIPLSLSLTKEYRKTVPVTRLRPFSTIPVMGVMSTSDTTAPKVNLISNNEYSVMMTHTGGGYSKWRGNDITRWRSDTTCDAWGSFCYIKDVQSGQYWSTTYQPTGSQGQNFQVHFKADKVEFRRRDEQIETQTEVVVAPQENVEVRLVTLANLSKSIRVLELTSYQELALAPHSTDRSHPCFNKFFIQTEADPSNQGILAFRRLRAIDDKPIWAGHIIASDQPASPILRFETDRSQFIGRGRTLSNPKAMQEELTNSVGYVLDPIFSLRRTITLEPNQRVKVAFVTVIGDNRDDVIGLMKKYGEMESSILALEMAWTHAQLELRHLRIDQEEAQLFQKLAGRILYPHAHLRLAEERLRKNRAGQSALWPYGISGDLPIIVATISDGHEIELIKQLLTAHTFWHLRGLKVDFVILNEESYSYDQPLFSQLNRMIHAQSSSHGIEIGKPGGIYLLNCSQMPEEDVSLILSVSSANLIAARGFLRQHLVSPIEAIAYPRALTIKSISKESPSKPLPFMELPYFNGLGGFTHDGKEYVVYLGPEKNLPAPWSNVIANSKFGTMVSETGLGMTWYGNSQTNRLTSWSNDPLLNPITDAIYIRDDELGVFWTPTPGPIRELDAYRIRHGQGYTYFEHNSHGIDQELLIYVPVDDKGGDPIRVQRLQLSNDSFTQRTFSIFAYSEMVLGSTKEETQMHLISEWDEESQAIFIYNRFNMDYGSYFAFAFSNLPVTSFSGSRSEFIGRNQNLANPAALRRVALSKQTGAALDPCIAIQVQVTLDPGQKMETAFFLGYAANVDEARRLIAKFRSPESREESFAVTKQWWDTRLSTIQVDCPDLLVNFAINRWLLYQNLSCRIWGRSGFYQSSGAYGFRDQLQDVLAQLYADPKIARDQILLAASRQFIEGDVQHWWLPPKNAGVRTLISDDLLWLPFVTAQYIRVTNDVSILSVVIPFLTGEKLKEGQHEIFFVPEISTESGTLLEHCRRAIAKASHTGPHHLPLIGSGDWNDGMNRVGIHGKGESVWLTWFLIHVKNDFADILAWSGQPDEGKKYRDEAEKLAKIVEKNAWDGKWYRRAYYDDGTPLGSALNEEDIIDSLPQSWAIISGAGNPERAKLALQNVDEHLVLKNEKLVMLLTPPFDKTPHDPGYIKGYPPGIRENGGQYTHGSLWVPLAYARIGDADKAADLLKMMHPVLHTQTPEDVEKYKIEPYVLAGDVYSAPGKVGRGGWSWYTGAASWMYRIWVEEIFGVLIRGDELILKPKLPSNWPKAMVTYKHHNTIYEVHIVRSDSSKDKQELKIKLVDDGQTHILEVMLPLA